MGGEGGWNLFTEASPRDLSLLEPHSGGVRRFGKRIRSQENSNSGSQYWICQAGAI